jgi:hypothetical protein
MRGGGGGGGGRGGPPRGGAGEENMRAKKGRAGERKSAKRGGERVRIPDEPLAGGLPVGCTCCWCRRRNQLVIHWSSSAIGRKAAMGKHRQSKASVVLVPFRSQRAEASASKLPSALSCGFLRQYISTPKRTQLRSVHVLPGVCRAKCVAVV